MGFLKKLLGTYTGGGHHGGGYGGKHGGGAGGKHGDRYGYSQPVHNTQPPAQKICPGCSTTNAIDAKFCQQCGKTLGSSNCSQCSTTLLPDAKFCPQCGKSRD